MTEYQDIEHDIVVHFCKTVTNSETSAVTVQDFTLATDYIGTPKSPTEYAVQTIECDRTAARISVTIGEGGIVSTTTYGWWPKSSVVLPNPTEFSDFTLNGEHLRNCIGTWGPGTYKNRNTFYDKNLDSAYKTSHFYIQKGDSRVYNNDGWIAEKDSSGNYVLCYHTYGKDVPIFPTEDHLFEFDWKDYEDALYPYGSLTYGSMQYDNLIPQQFQKGQAYILGSVGKRTADIFPLPSSSSETPLYILNDNMFTLNDSTGHYEYHIYLFPTLYFNNIHMAECTARFYAYNDEETYTDHTFTRSTSIKTEDVIDLNDTATWWTSPVDMPSGITVQKYMVRAKVPSSISNTSCTYSWEDMSVQINSEHAYWPLIYSENLISYDYTGCSIDESPFTVILDANGGSFPDDFTVTEYISTDEGTNKNSKEVTFTVNLPAIVIPPAGSGLVYNGLRTVPTYEHIGVDVDGHTVLPNIDITLKRNNYDTICSSMIVAEWILPNSDRARAYLCSQKDMKVDSLNVHNLDLGEIQTVKETYSSDSTCIPLMSYDSRSAFAYDTCVTKKIDLTVKRAQPSSVNDSSDDSTLWSNRKWLNVLKAFADRWQMGTDGCQFFLSIPEESYGEYGKTLYTEYGTSSGGQNCYIGSLNFNYSNDLPKAMIVEIPLTLGTMHPKKEAVASAQVTFTSGASDQPLGTYSSSIDAVAESIPFTVPAYPFKGNPSIVTIDNVEKYVSFKEWDVVYDGQPEGETIKKQAGDVISPGDDDYSLLKEDGLTFNAEFNYDDTANIKAAICDDPTKTSVKINNVSNEDVDMIVIISGGGGGGGGYGGEHHNSTTLGFSSMFYGYGGNGGSSGYGQRFTLTIPHGETTLAIKIGEGGSGGASVNDGPDGLNGGKGGDTSLTTSWGTPYVVGGGSGGLCRHKYDNDGVSKADSGYNAGGLGGTDSKEGSWSVTSEGVTKTISYRQGSIGGDADYYSGVKGTGAPICCGMAGLKRETYITRGSPGIPLTNINNEYYIIPLTPTDSSAQYYIHPGTRSDMTWTRYCSNGGGGGAPIMPTIDEWAYLEIGTDYPHGGDGGTLGYYRRVPPSSEASESVKDGSNPTVGTYGGGGGGAQFNGASGANGGNGYIFLLGAVGESGSITFS